MFFKKEVKNLIQVCYFISSEIKREISALIKASQELNCDDLTIITWDKEKEEKIKNQKIKFIPLLRWLITPFSRHYFWRLKYTKISKKKEVVKNIT